MPNEAYIRINQNSLSQFMRGQKWVVWPSYNGTMRVNEVHPLRKQIGGKAFRRKVIRERQILRGDRKVKQLLRGAQLRVST